MAVKDDRKIYAALEALRMATNAQNIVLAVQDKSGKIMVMPFTDTPAVTIGLAEYIRSVGKRMMEENQGDIEMFAPGEAH
jgi:hypothetical protein